MKDLIDFREVLSKIKTFTEFSGLALNKSKSFAMFAYRPENVTVEKCNGIRFVDKSILQLKK